MNKIPEPLKELILDTFKHGNSDFNEIKSLDGAYKCFLTINNKFGFILVNKGDGKYDVGAVDFESKTEKLSFMKYVDSGDEASTVAWYDQNMAKHRAVNKNKPLNEITIDLAVKEGLSFPDDYIEKETEPQSTPMLSPESELHINQVNARIQLWQDADNLLSEFSGISWLENFRETTIENYKSEILDIALQGGLFGCFLFETMLVEYPSFKSVEEWARRLFITPKYLADMICGTRSPAVNFIDKLTAIFPASTEYMQRMIVEDVYTAQKKEFGEKRLDELVL